MSRPRKRKPKNGQLWWPCPYTGKRGYGSKTGALAVASRAAKNFGRQGVYRCPHCSRWHLTTRSKKWGRG